MLNKINLSKGLTTIVKTTTNCNLNCIYCYEVKDNSNMDEVTLINTINKVANFNGPNKISEFIWHGGEPLLRGINFFERIVYYQNELCKEFLFNNKVQTNSTLMDKELAYFFKINNFKIGTSLDGPKRLNEKTRFLKKGDNAFKKIINGLYISKSFDILGGVICVVSKENVDELREIYDFFKEEGINIKLNPLLRSINSENYFNRIGIKPIEYGNALVDLFDYWWKEKEKFIDVEPFTQIIKGFLSKNPIGCNYRSNCCDDFISVSTSGNVYPCGRFTGFEEFCLGNINSDDILSFQKSGLKKSMKNREVKECTNCKYLYLCNSECPFTSYILKGNLNEKSDLCDSNKILFSHIEKILIRELKRI